MLLISKDLSKQMKEGTMGVPELRDYLLKTNTVYELASSLAELMIQVESNSMKRIVVSQEEYNAITSLFRVRGFTEDGKEIKTGRPKKEE